MIIVEDERNIKARGTCANCHAEGVIVRPIMERDWFGSERGLHYICFSCFGPRIFWKKGEGGKVIASPINQMGREVAR